MKTSRRIALTACLTVMLTASCQCADDAPVAEAPEPDAPAAAPSAAPAPAAAAPADAEFAGNTWTVTMVHAADGSMVGPAASAAATLIFTTDAQGSGYRLDGHTGCNGIGGDYHTDAGGGLEVASAMGSTSRDCPADVLALEDALTMGLISASSYSIDGNELTIEFDGGSIMATSGN